MFANLAHPNILNIVKSKCPNMDDARCIYDLLTTKSNKLDYSSGTINNNNENMKSEDFINTNAYKFFMDEANTKSTIDEQLLTEAELIDYIKQQGKYDDAFLAFYGERYIDNENILRAVAELQLQSNEKLKKENEILRQRVNQLSKNLIK